jgi:predicted permease
MDLLRQDLRYAVRRLGASPLFTLVAALSLALGIGANTAIFTVVNAILWSGPAVNQSDRMVEVYTSDQGGMAYATTSYPDYLDLRNEVSIFDEVVGYQLFIAQAEQAQSAAPVMGELVTGNYFETFGVRATLGRTFVAEESVTPGTHPVVVLGHGFWQRAHGADPSILGRTIQLNRRPYTVIGVLPASFGGMYPGLAADLFVPMMMADVVMPGTVRRLEQRGSRSLFLKARLAQGVSADAAATALGVIGARLAGEYPETNRGRVLSLVPSRDVSIHPMVDRALVPVAALLLAVVSLVLLIACANLASFLLARATDRRREIAVRRALGAGRGQLIRQMLVESVLLGLLGGTGGVLVARWATDLLVGFQPPLPIPINLDIRMDGSVLLFTLGVSVLAGIAFGLVPGLAATRPDMSAVLREEAGSVTGGRSRVSVRGILVAGQVAVSVVLLVAAGLFLRSLDKAQHIDPGFDTGPAAILWPNLELSGYDNERGEVVQRELRERLLATPGVTGVSVAGKLPLGAAVQTRGINVDGIEPPPGTESIDVDYTQADAAYFELMDIPIVSGRNFAPADASGDAVAIISEAMARRFWPDRDAVGEVVYLGAGRQRPVRVVGVARDTKVRTLGEAPRPYMYMNTDNEFVPSMMFLIRGTLPAPELVATARRAALDLDSDLVILEAKTMEEHLALLLYPPRMAAALLSVFGALALLLASIGLYGMVSYAVARRTREVGIRAALGASRGDIIRLMTGGGMRLILVGIGVGLALAGGVSWLLAGFLYGIRATDAATFIAVPLVLAAVGFMASWVPARRAATVDPIAALRTE